MNKAQLVTRNIAKKGFCGMRSSSPASSAVYLESDVLRIPFQAILPSLVVMHIESVCPNKHTNDKH